jgi:hypothetical protein
VILCAETSAVLRWLLGAPDGPALGAAMAGAEAVFSSRLTVVEVERVLVREERQGRLGGADAAFARAAFAPVQAQWHVVELCDEIARRAGGDFPVEPVRTLDAIHLATTLFVARLVGTVALLSTDERVRANGARLGLALVP